MGQQLWGPAQPCPTGPHKCPVTVAGGPGQGAGAWGGLPCRTEPNPLAKGIYSCPSQEQEQQTKGNVAEGTAL